MKRTAVYRIFDADGRLLYVGVSRSPLYRMAGHARSEWAREAESIDIDWFSTEHEAREAEASAIQSEQPIWNRTGKIAETARVCAHPELVSEIRAFCAEKGIYPSQFGKLALGDPRFVFDVEAGRELRRKTIGRARHYMETGITHEQLKGCAA